MIEVFQATLVSSTATNLQYFMKIPENKNTI